MERKKVVKESSFINKAYCYIFERMEGEKKRSQMFLKYPKDPLAFT